MKKEWLSPRKSILITILFSIGSLYFILQFFGGVNWNFNWQQIKWEYQIWCCFLIIFVWLAKAYRMRVLACGVGVKKDLSLFLQIYLATSFISHVTPFSSGGTPLQVYLLYKNGFSLSKATAITVVDLSINLIVFLILIPVTFFYNARFFTEELLPNLGEKLKLIFYIMLVLVIIFLMGYLYIKYILKNKKVEIYNYIINSKWYRRIRAEWTRFKRSWLILIHKKQYWLYLSFVGTVVYWFTYLALAPLIVWSLNEPVVFWDLMGKQLIYNLAQTVIPTPGGSGGSELVLGYLFHNTLGNKKIVVFVFLWKIYTFYLTLLIGSYYFYKLIKKSRK